MILPRHLVPLATVLLLLSFFHSVRADRPNVILIMSDDQGVGDYGFQGNSVIRTPELDAMFQRGGSLSRFYVSPVCAPTRASLMTGRYNYRTRCIDTYVGRAMMDSSERTLAEYLQDVGYRTGIYGKWHLGDNYPLRAMDQGFQDSLVHRGGGIGQPSDPIGAEGKYTDPTLIRNGQEVAMQGYCTDIYVDAALEFIEASNRAGRNFFAYIATNAPHGPFHDVPKELYEEYKTVDFTPILVNRDNGTPPGKVSDKLARIAAMITNIDHNVGRLFRKLNELGIADNTIVIYLNDNGPNTLRYVGDMRGMKSAVDDGGIRSPLLFHWPSRVRPGHRSDKLCAHIDVLPTILDACGVTVVRDPPLDGRSFLPLLTQDDAPWSTRQVVLQTHRGDTPEKFHHFALHEHPWKLVHPSGFGKEQFSGEPRLQLYNLHDDPRQRHNLAEERPKILARLRADYEAWFEDVSSTRPQNFAPPRIIVGTEHEPRSVLTRQDWRHTAGRPWAPNSNGTWLLRTESAGDFQLELIFNSRHPAGTATITVGNSETKLALAAEQLRNHVATIPLPAGECALSVDVNFAGAVRGPYQVILTRR